MKHRMGNMFTPDRYTVADIIDTEKGVLVDILEDTCGWWSKEKIVKDFINSICGQYELNFNGYNADEFREEIIQIKLKKLEKEYNKIKFIDSILDKKIRGVIICK